MTTKNKIVYTAAGFLLGCIAYRMADKHKHEDNFYNEVKNIWKSENLDLLDKLYETKKSFRVSKDPCTGDTVVTVEG